MKKKLIFIGLGILVVFLLLLGTYKLMNSRTYQVFGGLTDNVETNEKVVALTFDDGPSKNVNEILPLLAKYDVKATFFLIGNRNRKVTGGSWENSGSGTSDWESYVFRTGGWCSNRLLISRRKSRKRIN